MDRKVTLTDNAVKQIKKLREKQGDDTLMLRLSVLGGGCSGFQYKFDFASEIESDDIVFEKDDVKLLTDDASLDLLKGSEVDYVNELIGSSFQVNNPNAQSGCGCGVSFSINEDMI
ncbi:MAG: iron-sulfur cluster insertion protein ErpA [Rickettsiales bacterium]|nr:iron-sulfur cluster insertion protein ErpA [Rickettsiales bacterium]|tara:strand:+ start:733 stop:1080 length:348 start_codon:yes stop_codon:yes gene_type:complete